MQGSSFPGKRYTGFRVLDILKLQSNGGEVHWYLGE